MFKRIFNYVGKYYKIMLNKKRYKKYVLNYFYLGAGLVV